MAWSRHLCPRGLSDHLSPKIFPKCPLEWKFNPFKPASKKVEIDGLDQNRHLAHRPGQPKTIKESILTTYSFIYNNWFLSIILRPFLYTVHHPICGFFISQKSVHKSGFVHKSGESPQIESVGEFIHTTEGVHYNTGLFSDRVVL